MKLLSFILAGAIAAFSIPASAIADRVGVSSEHPSVSSNQEVAFSADFDGRTRIWVSALDGSRLRKVSSLGSASASAADLEPAWSPDGRQIAYVSFNGSNSDIWVVQADGAYPLKLTANGANNTNPSWSPDGSKIAFVSDKEGTKDIWLMNANGSSSAKLVTSDREENSPSFSPAGDEIVFSRTDGDVASLMIVKTNGTGLRTLTTGNFRDWEPSWGSRGILFSSDRDGSGRWKIWVVQSNGSGLRKLGDLPGHDPVWTADGRVLFTDESSGTKALAAISALDPATGVKKVVADVQGYQTPIDVRPGKIPNQINPRSLGKVRVAILSSASFDAAQLVVQKSLTFGRTGAESTLVNCDKPRDVNADGIADLVCRFDLRYADFQAGNTAAVLRFVDIKGRPFEGRDTIITVLTDDPDDFN